MLRRLTAAWMPLPVRLCAGLCVFLLAGCGKSTPLPNAAATVEPAVVRVAAVQTGGHVETEEVVGTIRSKLRARIEAKVSGRIEQMLAAPGQIVKAGDLLAQLDTREIQARLDQAVPVLHNTEIEVARFKSLVEQRAVSRSELDAIEARFRVAQAAVTEAETMLGHTRIIAPFAGVITRKLADVGDLASPGRGLLEIEDPRVLRLEADVPESLINRVLLGEKLKIHLASASEALQGVVSEIAPVADPATRTFLVKLDLPEQTGLRAGQFARLAIPLAESPSLRVPASAVLRRGQMEMVFVAQNNAAQLRLVKTGKRVGEDWEVVSGLAPNEPIVIEGAAALRDGQPIELKP